MNIEITPSYYEIKPIRSIPRELTRMLSKWDPVYFKRDDIGFYHDKDEKILRIPRGFPQEILMNTFSDVSVKFDKANPYDDINISLISAPRNYRQEHELAFMLGESPYDNFKNSSQIYVDLDTGEGKTFCGIASLCYFRCKGVIFIPPISKIGDQWMSSIEKFTTLKYSEYLYVKGSKMCEDIISGKYDDVKIFIIPRSTVLSFVNKYNGDWSMLSILMTRISPRIKIIDEAHMDFSTIVKIDCFTNVEKTYYMSSSPSRSEKQEKNIYSLIFKTVPKYGKKLKTKEQNHIVPLIIFFKSTPSEKWLKNIKNRYGISLAKYGEYLLAEDGARDEFLEAYLYAMHILQRLRRNGGKILVICITIEFAKEMKELTKLFFPNLSSGLYVGSGKDKAKELDNDIIFSTKQSMGTGSEIVNHQLTINTITYSSEIIADQLSGRIRKSEGRKTVYCELVNINHPQARTHFEKRKPYLMKKAKNGNLLTHTINSDDIKMIDDLSRSKSYYDEQGRLYRNNRLVIGKRKR